MPLHTPRRKLLVALRIRGAGGQAHTEAEPEAAFRPTASTHATMPDRAAREP